jgi:hypothetical protein
LLILLVKTQFKSSNPEEGYFRWDSDFPQFHTRSFHAIVDRQGTLTYVPFGFFKNILRHLTLAQDSHLIAVHQRLMQLQTEIQNPQSPILRALREEVHRQGDSGARNLISNLTDLSECFASGNNLGIWTTTLLKVINFIRTKILGLPPLTRYHYQPINLNLFQQQVILPALELTSEDRLRSPFNFTVQNHSPFPLSDLSSDHLLKLERGLLSSLRFTIDQKHFNIYYDRPTRRFTLTYSRNERHQGPSVTPEFADKRSRTYESEVIQVTERRPNSSSQTHPLRYSWIYTYQPWRWYNPFQVPFIEGWSYEFNPGQLPLTANSEFTIPLSQGHILLKIEHRST